MRFCTAGSALLGLANASNDARSNHQISGSTLIQKVGGVLIQSTRAVLTLTLR